MKEFFPHISKSLPIQIKEAIDNDFIEVDKKMLLISFLSFLGTALLTSYTYNTYFLGVVGGGVALIISIIAYIFYRGTLISRLLFGIIFMIYPSIMVQQQLGMIEMHFAFFYMISFLMMYKDISPVLIGAFVVTVHHVVLTYLQLNNVEVMGIPLLIFGPNCSWTITFIHMTMWTFALVVYIHMIIKNTQQFIKIRTDNTKLTNQAKELDDLNLTLEQKVVERTVELSEQKLVFETLFNETSDGISLLKDGKFTACNNAVLKLLEYKNKDNFLNLQPFQLSPEFQPDGQKSEDKTKKLIERCLQKGSDRFEWLHTKSTGDNLWVEIVLTKIKIKDEDVIHVVWRDISKKKQLDEQIINRTEELEESNDELQRMIHNLKMTQNKLIESEKMASLGGLVAGVAHEINTPVGVGLTGITHFLSITKDIENKYTTDVMTQEEFEKYLNASRKLANLININLERTSHLIKSFKQVAVDQTSEKERQFELKQYIDDTIFSLNNIIKKTNLTIEIKSKNININSYPGAYSQIITNLIINSIQHGYEEKEKGTISIDISKENNTLYLIYKDDGKGISKENLPKVFEPFFTTNREHGGTGLGLNVIYNIVTNNLKGTIKCNSKEGYGVEFRIIVPLNRMPVVN